MKEGTIFEAKIPEKEISSQIENSDSNLKSKKDLDNLQGDFHEDIQDVVTQESIPEFEKLTVQERREATRMVHNPFFIKNVIREEELKKYVSYKGEKAGKRESKMFTQCIRNKESMKRDVGIILKFVLDNPITPLEVNNKSHLLFLVMESGIQRDIFEIFRDFEEKSTINAFIYAINRVLDIKVNSPDIDPTSIQTDTFIDLLSEGFHETRSDKMNFVDSETEMAYKNYKEGAYTIRNEYTERFFRERAIAEILGRREKKAA